MIDRNADNPLHGVFHAEGFFSSAFGCLMHR